MSSKTFKAVFAGAVTAGALFLPVSAAQAAPSHHCSCDSSWGFGGDRFFDDGFGGFRGHDIGMFDDGFGFPRHHIRHDRPTVIIVNVKNTKKVKAGHHKGHHAAAPADAAPADAAPADNTPSGNANANGGHDGYTKPAAVSPDTKGYRKG